MSTSVWLATRVPRRQVGLAIVGATVFCIYARTWRDVPHAIYDIPASIAAFAFVAQLLLEVTKDGASWFWGSRLALLVAMTVVTSGRAFLGWEISGHLSCVLAIAIVQAADARLGAIERLLYWIPLPIVLVIRWTLFDQGQHWQTYSAVIFAVAASLPVVLLARLGTAR